MASAQNGVHKTAAVVGGSLSGLMNAIVLRHEGYKVHVLERSHRQDLLSEAAGLGVGPNVHTFIETYIPNYNDYAIMLTEMEVWNEKAELQTRIPAPTIMRMTNWKTVYDILKQALLDADRDFPPAVYKTSTEVIDVRVEGSGVLVWCRVVETGTEESLHVDLVIAADGANSRVRRKLWQDTSPGYAGYVLWRGRVPDTMASEEAQQALKDKIAFQHLENGYMLSYVVPAELKDNGERDSAHKYDLFWAFYDVMDDRSPEFQQTMTDTEGKVHRNTIPKGKMQTQVWKKASARIIPQACRFYVELMEKTKNQIYVSAIKDFPNTKAVLCGGKVILAGDAMSQCRPHAGGATNEHAFQALGLSKVLRGENSLEEWEKVCLESAAKARATAIVMGKRFLPEGTIP